MTTDETPRPVRRSRTLEALERQNTSQADRDLTDDDINIISDLILRLGDLPNP